jgi:peroxiredoxin
VGQTFPELALNLPQSQEVADYLGLETGPGTFDLAQIEADVLIVEAFSMYCPICQRNAPSINELFEKLSSPDLGGKVKMLGIGVGNSDFEVNFFKEKYQVKFPLFSDQDFKVYEELGKIRTPYFWALKPAGAEGAKVILAQIGEVEDTDQFLKQILQPVSTSGGCCK